MIMLLTNNIRVFKSGRIRWAGHMELMEERQVPTDVWCGNMKTETTRKTKREWEYNIRMNLK